MNTSSSNRTLRRTAALFALTCTAMNAAAFPWTPSMPPLGSPVTVIPAPIQKSCGSTTTAGSPRYGVDRDIRVQDYPGWSVYSSTFRYSASVAGSYRFKISIHDTSRGGDRIAVSGEQFVAFSAGEQKQITTFLGNAYLGQAINISVSHVDVSGPGTLYFHAATAPCAGVDLSNADGTASGISADIAFALHGDTAHRSSSVVEYFFTPVGKYFITTRAAEQASLDAVSDSSVRRTGRSFRMPDYGVYGNLSSIYRLYDQTSHSHQYVDKSTYDGLLAMGPSTGLMGEGPAFASVLPDSRHECPSWSPVEIRRSYHNTVDAASRSYRYTKTLADYDAMTAAGWIPEGVVLCAYM